MFLLIDKPIGFTSHDVVNTLRKITGVRKVGHAGTLDPNATGLLIVGIGRESTKKLGLISKNLKKTYTAEVFLGETRDTDDAEGKIIRKFRSKTKFSKEYVLKVLSSFVGKIEQTPPVYSALKIRGNTAYKLAREGKHVELLPRKVSIYSIKLLKYSYPYLVFKTVVSAGTYIRALARDIGAQLGCGAYLKNLRREKIGKYDVRDALPLKDLNSNNWNKFSINI